MDIEARLNNIEARNTKVEMDKAWETSWQRKVCITVFTYGIALAWLLVIEEANAWLKAVVPAVGYVLSTLSLTWFRLQWQDKNFSKLKN